MSTFSNNVLNGLQSAPSDSEITSLEPKLSPNYERSSTKFRNNQRILAALAFAFIIIVIGIPMWWKATEVYRVPLPYNKINQLNDNPIKVLTKVGIWTNSEDRTDLLIKELNEIVSEAEESGQYDTVQIKFKAIRMDKERSTEVQTPLALELLALKYNQFLQGDFMFLEWPKFTEDILVTSEPATQIYRVLEQWIIRLPKLRSIKQTAFSLQHTDKKVKRNLGVGAPPSSKYDVMISVFSPQPSKQKVRWDVRAAVNAYLIPFVNQIEPVSKIVVKTEWKYQVPFEFVKKQNAFAQNASDIYYAIMEENLSYLITSIEGKLGNSIEPTPTIHIVVYVTPCENNMLHFYKSKDDAAKNSSVDSFLSPKWGGVIIANPTREKCAKISENEEKNTIKVNSHDVMQTAIYILRQIIDIHVDMPISNANIVPWEAITPRSWEIDSHLRIRAVHLITSATSTLQSLIQLLDGIRNIVINDDVGRAINSAYDNINKAKKYLKENKLIDAINYAREAFECAERAFFDPSLLALLYFPDDQKYAIYIPLFLPVMIPIVLSFGGIFKHFLKMRNKVKAE